MRTLLLLLLLQLTSLAAYTLAQNTFCNGNDSALSYVKGKCVEYKGLCAGVVGNSIFLPDLTGTGSNKTWNIETFEFQVREGMRLLRQNKGLVSDACISAGDEFMCSSNIYKCDDSHGEPVPILPCEEVCSTFWNSQNCKSVANNYYQLLLKAKDLPVSDSSFPFCDNGGSFTAAYAPPDVFGVRPLPGYPPWPAGLEGVLRYPKGTYNYVNSLGNVISNLQCYVPKTLSYTIDISVQCAYPLVKDKDGTCVVPCPFPIVSPEQSQRAIIAFVVPGLISVFLCAFVFLDSVWVILEATGGSIVRFLRRYGLVSAGGGGSSTHNNNNSSAQENAAALSGGAQTSGGGGRKKTQLRASVLYALLGSALGLVFFFVGPLGSLVLGDQVSCAFKGASFNMDGLINEKIKNRDQSNDFCRAQRIMPFVLQAIFNLTLYAMVKVYLVVTNTKVEGGKGNLLEACLLLYCMGVPIMCLIIHSQIDKLSTNFDWVSAQVTRQAIICVGRYENAGTEFGLIFLPYIITGTMITGLSFVIYRSLRGVQNKVAGLQSDTKKTTSEVALQLLLYRLMFLGLFTFFLLIVLMATTGTVLDGLAAYGKAFGVWFKCETAAQSCESCDKYLSDMKVPSVDVIAVQLFCMSSISLAFAGFFAAQSASRLYKEYLDGSLILKIDAVWYGTGGAYAHAPSSVLSGNSPVAANYPSQMNTYGGKIDVVASYMKDDA